MLNVGLTGGIASGKSTVAAMLVEKGAFHIDFDVLAHNVEEPDQPAWQEIVAVFGKDILNENRTINRERLGEIVFRNRDKLRSLNEIVHPAVLAAWRGQIATITAQAPQAIILADVPLLIEVGMQQMVDLVVLVYISPAEQVRRLIARNGYTREEALARLASQMPIQEKLPLADLIVNNEGSLTDTSKQIDDLWPELIRREKIIK